MNITAWSIPGADDQTILGNTHLSDEPRGTLVICHGFKGYKDYGFFPMLAAVAAKRHLIAHRFNFSHSGMTNKIETFERPDLFENDTWSKQVHDVNAVMCAIESGKLAGSGLPLILFGHSRGGVTVLLAASRKGADLAGVVAAAAPHQASALDDQQEQLLRDQGFLESPSSRTGQRLRVGRASMDEIDIDPTAWDPIVATKAMQCPILLIHGSADQTVPLHSARALFQAGGERASLSIIEDASHTFDAPNPLAYEDSPPSNTQRLIDLACEFVLRCSEAGG